MNTRVIDDPSALGWEYDPATGRWAWGGGSSSDGDGGAFPEAPVDGKQYGRQDAGWTEIVHTDGGGDSGPVTTADVALVNPTRLPSGLENQQDANAYIAESLDKLIDQDGNVIAGGIEEAPSDSVIYGRRNKDWVVVPTAGGGDTDLSAYYTAAQCDDKFEPRFTKNTAFNKNFGVTSTTVAQGNHSHDGVYQPVGSYLTAESDPTVPPHVKSISQADINKWNNPPSGGGDDPNAVKLTGDQTINGTKTFAGGVTYFQNLFISGVAAGGVGLPGAARIEFSSGATTLYGSSNTLQVFSGGTSITGNITATGTITGTDCIATSDERLKDNVEQVKAGVITQLQGVEFNWKDSGVKASGFIAQEVEGVPELQHLVHQIDKDGHKGVSYIGMIPYLLEEIKNLKAEIEELKR